MIAELISTDEEENYSNIVVEVSGGVGGQEAMLFAKEIHDMYYNYFAFVDWKCELSDYELTEIGAVFTKTVAEYRVLDEFVFHFS